MHIIESYHDLKYKIKFEPKNNILTGTNLAPTRTRKEEFGPINPFTPQYLSMFSWYDELLPLFVDAMKPSLLIASLVTLGLKLMGSIPPATQTYIRSAK